MWTLLTNTLTRKIQEYVIHSAQLISVVALYSASKTDL